MRPVGDQVDLERPVGGGADRGTYRRTRVSPGAGHRIRVGDGHTEELEKPDGLGERAFSIGSLRILKGRHRVSHFGGNLFRGEQRGHPFDHLPPSRVLHPQPDAIRGDHRRGERGEPVGGLGDGDCRDPPPGKKGADKARGGGVVPGVDHDDGVPRGLGLQLGDDDIGIGGGGSQEPPPRAGHDMGEPPDPAPFGDAVVVGKHRQPHVGRAVVEGRLDEQRPDQADGGVSRAGQTQHRTPTEQHLDRPGIECGGPGRWPRQPLVRDSAPVPLAAAR